MMSSWVGSQNRSPSFKDAMRGGVRTFYFNAGLLLSTTFGEEDDDDGKMKMSYHRTMGEVFLLLSTENYEGTSFFKKNC